jgi:hypothetical protein
MLRPRSRFAASCTATAVASLLAACSSAGPSSGDQAPHDSAQGGTPSTVWVQPSGGGAVQVAFEPGYIGGVVTAETGGTCGSCSAYAQMENYRAQAVAARTYVLNAIARDSSLGTQGNPIVGGPSFQAWTSQAGTTETQAATSTAGLVMSYGGQLIDANYDAGGYAFDGSGNPQPPRYYWPNSSWSSWDAARNGCCGASDPGACVTEGNSDPAGIWTQIYVTDNQSKSGGSVAGTCQASSGAANRGAFGQNWSAELAFLWPDNQFTYKNILAFFYGADITIGSASTPGTGSNPCSGVSSANSGLYCGSSAQNGFGGGSPTLLYDCEGGRVAHTQTCSDGCRIAPAGQNDSCYADPCTHVSGANSGKYCGSSTQSAFAGASSDIVYDCEGGKTAGVQTCQWGCYIAPAGQSDGCKADPCANVSAANSGEYCGSSNQSGFGGGSSNVLYTCANGATTKTQTCSNGCHIAPAGQQDSCN